MFRGNFTAILKICTLPTILHYFNCKYFCALNMTNIVSNNFLNNRIINFLLRFYWGSGPPPNYIEIINSKLMTTDVTMVKDWEACLLMFSEPLSKCSRGFTYIFPIAVNPATLESIDHPTLFKDWILILGGHQEAFDGFSSFKVQLYTMFATGLFEALTHTLMIGYHHVGLLALVAVDDIGVFVLCSCHFGLWSYFDPVQCPFLILASGECLV